MRKNNIGVLVVGLLAFIGYKYYENINKFIETVTFKVHKMNVDLLASLSSGLKFIILPSVFNINNTTTITATINGIALDFFYNDKLVGTVGSTNEVQLKPEQSTLLSTTVKLSTEQLLKIVPSVKEFLNGKRSFVIKGVIKTSLGNVKVNETVTV